MLKSYTNLVCISGLEVPKVFVKYFQYRRPWVEMRFVQLPETKVGEKKLFFQQFSPDLNPKVSAHVKVDKITIVQRIPSHVGLVLQSIKKAHEILKYFPFLTVVKVGRNVKRSITPIPMMRGYEIMMKYLVIPKSSLSLIKYYYLYLAFLTVILRKFLC